MVRYGHMSLKTDQKLKEKKYRSETGLFILEGEKGVLELLDSEFKIVRIYTTLEASATIDSAVTHYRARMETTLPEVHIVSQSSLETGGTITSNNSALAVAHIPTPHTVEEILGSAHHTRILALDDVQDPGNLGTIIRTADWFGITHIVTSLTSVDSYNPKVIRASMGSFTRVQVTGLDLETFLTKAHVQKIKILGAFLHGEHIDTLPRSTNGILVMGSESHGISASLSKCIDTKVTIPKYGNAESLNVAVATGILLSVLKHK